MTLVKKILALMRYKLWFKGLLNGIPATIELEKLLKDIKVPETIIDIGSNKGQFILLMEELFPNKMVYSFEPIIEIDASKSSGLAAVVTSKLPTASFS